MSAAPEPADSSPTVTDLAEAFDLHDVEPTSLTPWARVYRARSTDGVPVVVKRTAARADRAHAMARWTRSLAATGVPVVVSIGDPRQVGEDWWVVYPWAEGAAYEGTVEQIRAAGDLLGRLHAAGGSGGGAETAGLRSYEWPTTDADDVASDLATLDVVLADHPELAASVRALGQRWWDRALPALRDADLPRTGVSSDYKANNLVFTATDGPVLVDPDNGGVEPRLFDLAMALVLFHTECAGAPGRLFTADEWATFAGAYLTHVELTAAERALWPAAVDHMLWEEGTWVLEDSDDAAWADARQRAYLLDLAAATPERYPLPDPQSRSRG
ncbi:phosphotransferase enzyme family protein [Oerskovia flava]|uniref:phosphotransferase enzyme family protein n=1 Tax=Oerskovia flava TaxID=2986422 RepID=UPI00223EC3CD|nr:phosphotransferase [Oerskovia sp. JB1-3-2]